MLGGQGARKSVICTEACLFAALSKGRSPEGASGCVAAQDLTPREDKEKNIFLFLYKFTFCKRFLLVMNCILCVLVAKLKKNVESALFSVYKSLFVTNVVFLRNKMEPIDAIILNIIKVSS